MPWNRKGLTDARSTIRCATGSPRPYDQVSSDQTVEIRRVRALLGPNLWADVPMAEIWCDLSDHSPDDLAAASRRLRARLSDLFPGLDLPRRPSADQGHLKHEQWLARALLATIVELVARISERPGFSQVRRTSERGIYRLVCQLQDGLPPQECAAVAVALCRSALTDTAYDLQGSLDRLRTLAGDARPSTTCAALLSAAKSRGIPARRLAHNVLQLGYGARQRRLQGSTTDRSAAAQPTATERDLLRTLLACVGVTCTDEPAAGQHYRMLVAGRRVLAALAWQPGRDDNGGGPTVTDVSHLIHPELCARAVDCARVLGLERAEVRLIAADLTQPLAGQGGQVSEVIANPPLDRYLEAVRTRSIAEAFLDTLYRPGENGRIPIVAVSGTNGKTTVTRLVAHGLSVSGRFVGMTCTDGIYLADRRIDTDDCSGPQSARLVLLNPEVDAAVLETARGGILREGLGFDACDVAVVTNIGEGDHLGLSSIDTVEDLAEVKQTVVRGVAPWGTAVLNAADPLVVRMADHCKGKILFFARDSAHPVLLHHRRHGGRVACIQGSDLVLAEGETERLVLALDRIPLTHGGRIGFQVENALSGAAALWALGLPMEALCAALETFGTDLDKSPGRFNVLSINGATAVFDYGHNPSALLAMIDALAVFPHRRRIAVYSAAGDRRDADLIRQGQLLGQAFDRVILYEDQYVRGRQPGEIMSLFRKGLAAGDRVQEVDTIHGWQDAVEAALWLAQPGDLLLVQADSIDETVAYVRTRLAEDLSRRDPLLNQHGFAGSVGTENPAVLVQA
jgi:cyanophycin synthetase